MDIILTLIVQSAERTFLTLWHNWPYLLASILAIPMQIESIDGFTARCQAKGVWRDVSLFMMQDEPPVVGDFVMVHVGYAIQKIAESDARTTWELLDHILEESGA